MWIYLILHPDQPQLYRLPRRVDKLWKQDEEAETSLVFASSPPTSGKEAVQDFPTFFRYREQTRSSTPSSLDTHIIDEGVSIDNKEQLSDAIREQKTEKQL